ncbi:hypothetical protein llap_15279 [Limosa lapponica baueri]|uniref:Trinucleotide repeat-containing gene 6c protein n=1 Tax=Limosa lapponica baueri TaxID=1758121 RepID=A0A2I0TKU8_LIMLA|nr:hypothetical protein llap_15279 [Limosa lapponica baueri]
MRIGQPLLTVYLGDLSHSGLGDHYENSHWGQQPAFRSEGNCSWDKVIIDRTDKEAWPSITGAETESASECTTDTDSASNCGSENSSMATGSAQGNFTGHTKKTNGNNGANGALVQSTSNQSALGAGGANGNGNSARVWGVAAGSSSGLAHCSASGGDGKMDNMMGDGRSQNCWGASNSNAGINLNLNPNANPAAWPVLGHEGTVGAGNPSSICSPVSAIGQNMGNQNGNPTGTLGAWGNLLPQESTEPQTSTSQNVSFSVQPQNLNTDGPNNTNPMNSSPNPINAMQTNGLPNWGMAVGMGAIIPPHLQGLPGANGTSVSQVSGGSGEGMGSSVWGMSPGNPATGNSNSGFSQGNGDTVNSALSAKQNGSSSAVQKEGNGASAWDSGPPSGPGVLAWGRGGGTGGVGSMHSGAWGHPNRNTSNGVNGEWGKPSNQHSNSDINGKGSTGWESSSVTSPNPAMQPGNEQMNSWAKAAASGTTASEGSNDSGGSQNEGSTGREGAGEGRRRDKGMIDQGQVQLPRNDLDPRVLSNTGWGQTPVKQNTAWEFEESPRSERKNDNGTEAWGCAATQSSNSGGKNDGSIMNSTNTSSVSGWVNSPPAAVPTNTGWGDNSNKAPNGPGGWGESASSTTVTNAAAAKSGHAWSGTANQEDKSPTWGEPQKPKSQNWGDGQKSNPSWTSGGGDWTDSSSVPGHLGDGKKNGSGWDSDNRSGSGWNDSTRSGTSGWGNGTNSKANTGTSWGESLKPNPQQNWANKPQDNNVSNWGGAASVKQTGSGWVGGPVPAKQKENCEATGWEEPSPPSIRRKMEIDDGTSAWGDPNYNNNKTVNMWDRNNPIIQSSTTTNTTTTSTIINTNMVEPQPSHQSSAQPNRSPLLGPASKSMQEGWGSGGDEVNLSTSQWEDEEGDMWNNTASQESSSSCNSWGNAPKKGLQKGMKTSSKQDEAWIMNRLIKQLTDMGFPVRFWRMSLELSHFLLRSSCLLRVMHPYKSDLQLFFRHLCKVLEVWDIGYMAIFAMAHAGLNPNMNVNNMDITGGLSVKDTSQSQSRLPQWTHPNSMDNLSSAASSLDQNSSKHGSSPTSSQNATLPSSSAWPLSASGYSSSFSSIASAPSIAGSAWSTDSSGRTSSWLVLRNLTPQIDGSTLRTLCLQHGPLITFHLNLTQGNAVVRYSSKEEAAKAQKSLHIRFKIPGTNWHRTQELENLSDKISDMREN